MGWQATGDVAEFLGTAGDFLRAERARNTVMLSVTESLRANKPLSTESTDPDKSPLFGWLADDREPAKVTGAFMHTPPFPLLLTAVPAEAAAGLAAKALNGRPVAGVNSYQETAAAFAAAWRERVPCQVDVLRRMRLYRLAELSWPDPPPDGAPRPGAAADAALLTDWLVLAFSGQ